MPERFQLFTLGGLRLRLGGERLEGLSARKEKALLVYLAAQRRAVPREVLAEMFWSDRSLSRSLSNLRVALTDLRKHVAPYVIITRETVAIDNESDVWLDAATMEAELEAAGTLETAHGRLARKAMAQIEAAVDRYEGEFLHGFFLRDARDFDEWVTVERERLQKMVLDGLGKLVEWHLEQGAYRAGIDHARHLLQLDPLQETAQQQLMRLLAYSGQQAAALSEYQTFAALLEDEMGIEPMAETTALYQDIKEQRLPLPPADHARAREPHRWHAERPAFLEENEGQRPLHQELFIGREPELALLEKHLEQALAGQGRMVFVTGEAGSGKTSLLREFSLRSQRDYQDLVVAAGACPVYTGTGSPYAPFRQILAMLLGDIEAAWKAGKIGSQHASRLWRLFPEALAALLQHGSHLPGSLISVESLVARARTASVGRKVMERLGALAGRLQASGRRLSEQRDLFAEYAGFLIALSNRHALLLILDDLHWADPSSIGLLTHLGHRLPEGALLLVGAYRPEEVSQGREGKPHPLTPVLAEYKRRFGQVFIDLDDSEVDGGRTFVNILLDKEKNALGEEFRQALTRRTNGHPLFTVELWREMRERGALVRDEEDRWVVRTELNWDLVPSRVEGVIETRISRLDDELRQWLDLAAVEGEAFTAEVIAHVTGVGEHVVVKRLSRELDRQLRLITSQGVRRAGAQRLSRYQFRHHLFRQFLYNRLDDVERCYLHQRVGETLERLFEPQSTEIADELAHHFQMASLAEKTITYMERAGDNATDVYAYDEAEEYYQQALALAKELTKDGQDGDRVKGLFTKLGRVLEHKGNAEEALTLYREMESLGGSLAHQSMVLDALAAQATLYSIPCPVHDPQQAKVISEKALTLAQELGDQTAESRILRNLMTAYGYGNQLEDAIKFGERSLVLARDLGLRRQLAFVLNDLAGWYWTVGQIDKAKELFQEAVDIWREFGNLPMLADVLNQSSFASMFKGDFEDAIALAEESWHISKSIGQKWNLAFSRSRIGFAHRAQGELGLSIEVAEESLRLGETHDLPNPQIFAGAELAFSYAYLGVTDLGVNSARSALAVADEKVPVFCPYLLAALAQNHLVNGDLSQAEEVVYKARSHPHWQALPVLCIALTLADGRVALARADYDRALQLADGLLDQIRRLGARSYRPEALELSGQALFKLGRVEEARSRLGEAREEAEVMDAKGYLWPLLYHLSQLESTPKEAARLRQQAREIVEVIANNAGSDSLRASFLALREVRAVLESVA